VGFQQSWSKKENTKHCQSKETRLLWSHHEETRELPGERETMQGTMPEACRRGRPCTAWMGNVKTWTRLTIEKSIRMAEDENKWRKYVHDVANPRIEDG